MIFSQTSVHSWPSNSQRTPSFTPSKTKEIRIQNATRHSQSTRHCTRSWPQPPRTRPPTTPASRRKARVTALQLEIHSTKAPHTSTFSLEALMSSTTATLTTTCVRSALSSALPAQLTSESTWFGEFSLPTTWKTMKKCRSPSRTKTKSKLDSPLAPLSLFYWCSRHPSRPPLKATCKLKL